MAGMEEVINEEVKKDIKPIEDQSILAQQNPHTTELPKSRFSHYGPGSLMFVVSLFLGVISTGNSTLSPRPHQDPDKIEKKLEVKTIQDLLINLGKEYNKEKNFNKNGSMKEGMVLIQIQATQRSEELGKLQIEDVQKIQDDGNLGAFVTGIFALRSNLGNIQYIIYALELSDSVKTDKITKSLIKEIEELIKDPMFDPNSNRRYDFKTEKSL